MQLTQELLAEKNPTNMTPNPEERAKIAKTRASMKADAASVIGHHSVSEAAPLRYIIAMRFATCGSSFCLSFSYGLLHSATLRGL